MGLEEITYLLMIKIKINKTQFKTTKTKKEQSLASAFLTLSNNCLVVKNVV